MTPAVSLEYNFDTAVSLFDWPKFAEAFLPYFHSALEVIRGEVIAATPVGFSGNARRSVATLPPVVTANEIRSAVTVGQTTESPLASYWPYIEYGRGPGRMPPWDVGSPLFQWTKKTINANPANFPTARTHRKTVDADSKIRSVSFLIARAIANHGTRRYNNLVPAPFSTGLDRGFLKAQALLEDGVAMAFATLNE